MNNIGLKEIANIASVVSHYEGVINYFTQLGSGEASEKLVAYWESKNLANFDSRYWSDIDLHVVAQGWGNTSGGWQTIGGAAMVRRHTVIIENRWTGLSFIYYEGELAYVCEMCDIYRHDYQATGYKGLPGSRDCKKLLRVLYAKQ